VNLEILVAYDFSPTSEKALAWAAELARATGTTKITVLHVLAMFPPAMLPLPAVSLPDPEDLDGFRARLREATDKHGLTQANVELVVAADAGAQIVISARKVKATLIVMGTLGRGTLKRMVLGSVADYVVRHADCPVVTLRAHDAA
jgi:nucleotide-binding universal stress UspA family protein